MTKKEFKIMIRMLKKEVVFYNAIITNYPSVREKTENKAIQEIQDQVIDALRKLNTDIKQIILNSEDIK